MDASNRRDIKIVPVIILYFNPLEGMQVQLLKICNLPGETSEILSDCTIKVCADAKILDSDWIEYR